MQHATESDQKTLTEAWEAIQVEVMIFAVTLLVALTFRGVKALRPLRQPKVSEGLSKKEQSPRGPKKALSLAAAGGRPSKSLSHVDAVKLAERICESAAGAGAGGIMTLYEELRAREGLPETIKRAGKTPTEFYTAVTQCAVRGGRVEVLDIAFDDMEKHGMPRTRALYETAMKMLAGKKQFKEALAVYDRLAADGIEPSPVTRSCLVNFAVEVGDLNRAVTFFESMLAACKPSVRACMTILRVYARQENWTSTLQTLRHMQRLEVPIDTLVLNVILATGVATAHAKQAEELLEEALSYDPPVLDVISYNTVLKGHAMTGQVEKAILLLQAMRQRGVLPNAISYNTAMDGAIRSGRPDEAWTLLKVMRKAGLRPDKFTCAILARACNDGVSLSLLREVFTSLRSEGLVKISSGPLCSAIFDAAARASDARLMLEVYQDLRALKMPIGLNTYRQLFEVLSSRGEGQRCCEIWAEALEEQDAEDDTLSIFSALTEACTRNGLVKDAVRGFEALYAQRDEAVAEECRVVLIRHLIRHNSLDEAMQVFTESPMTSRAAFALILNLLEQSQKRHEAVQVFESMELQHGVKPSMLTTLALLRSCLQGRQLDLALQVFHRIKAMSTPPTGAMYRLVILGCANGGRPHEALDLLEEAVKAPDIQDCSLHNIAEALGQAFRRRKQGAGQSSRRLQELCKAHPEISRSQETDASSIDWA